jgi:LIVCS family branched-chain amino acid:cation transporter
MEGSQKISPFAVGMAIFAMFFGAGNIVFPLALGMVSLDKTPMALIGLFLGGVIMPYAGILTMFFYDGDVSKFFGRIGKTPGLILSFITIGLIGPLGCIPRSVAVAHSTLSVSFEGISMILFSSIFCLSIFALVVNKGKLLSLIGYVLSPFKIGLLILMIIIGCLLAPELSFLQTTETGSTLFVHALKEGYNTMDLLGAFFFAPVIVASLSAKSVQEKGYTPFVLKACLIGAAFQAAVYAGFCYLAYLYASALQGVPMEQLLGAIAFEVFGTMGGILVSITVTVACFTTAIALTGAFASFVQKELFSNKVGYIPVVIGTLIVTFVLSTLEFQGLAAYLGPVLQVCYPILILLTLYNLASYFLFPERKTADCV